VVFEKIVILMEHADLAHQDLGYEDRCLNLGLANNKFVTHFLLTL
jgi:hypothetical protein